MFGRVALRRDEPSFCGTCSGYRMGALGAKLRRGRKLAATLGAARRQCGRALFAELRPGTILVLAPRTLHLTPRGPGANGRDGGTNLAPGTTRVNNGLDDI